MGMVAGILIAIVNQILLHWRLRQLKSRKIIEPKQIINHARLSLIERLLLVGILLVLAMQQFEPLAVILSFFIVNLGTIFYTQCQLKS